MHLKVSSLPNLQGLYQITLLILHGFYWNFLRTLEIFCRRFHLYYLFLQIGQYKKLCTFYKKNLIPIFPNGVWFAADDSTAISIRPLPWSSHNNILHPHIRAENFLLQWPWVLKAVCLPMRDWEAQSCLTVKPLGIELNVFCDWLFIFILIKTYCICDPVVIGRAV